MGQALARMLPLAETVLLISAFRLRRWQMTRMYTGRIYFVTIWFSSMEVTVFIEEVLKALWRGVRGRDNGWVGG